MSYKSGLFSLLMICVSFSLTAAEYGEGAIRLVLYENTGRFSLYSSDGVNRGSALFSDQDPRTSFLSVMVNDRSYKMGDSSSFRTSLAGDNPNPEFVFESPFITVTEEFSFVKSSDSAVLNGIRILITLENRSEEQIEAGARFLLDTDLGEGKSGSSFTTDRRTINSETLLTRLDADQYWIDRNDKLSLAGSFITGSPDDPDSIHFANWKRLNDVTWKLAYRAGRDFNFSPYSIGDSALCYYSEPRPLGRGEKRSFAFTLAIDIDGVFNFTPIPSAAGAGGAAALAPDNSIQNLDNGKTANSREGDLAELRELIAKIDRLILSGTATDKEISDIDFALNKLRAKYSLRNNLR